MICYCPQLVGISNSIPKYFDQLDNGDKVPEVIMMDLVPAPIISLKISEGLKHL